MTPAAPESPVGPPFGSPTPRRVVLTGSESVGKTTLAAQLAAHYGAPCVPEFVRGYAAAKGAPLGFGDHGPIARGQVAQEEAALAAARAAGAPLLLLDTDLLSTVVYCRHYFGHAPAFLVGWAHARRPDLYLLLDVDVPWVADGVRDRGDRRAEVQAQFAEALAALDTPVSVVRGDWPTRFAQAVAAIDALLAAAPHSPLAPDPLPEPPHG